MTELDEKVEYEERVLHEPVPAGTGFYKYTFKVALVGSSGCGKSSLYFRLAYPDVPLPQLPPTFMTEFGTQSFLVDDCHDVHMQIWDTSGALFARDAVGDLFIPESPECCDAAILCFDVTRPRSLHSALQWLPVIHDYKADPLIVLCGTMAGKSARRVSFEEIQEVVAKYHFKVTEACAETGMGVAELFGGIAAMLYRKRENIPEPEDRKKEIAQPKEPAPSIPPPVRVVHPVRRCTDPNRVGQEYEFKFLILGPRGVGKTSFLSRFSDDIYDPVYTPSVAAEPARAELLAETDLVMCTIWDLPGMDPVEETLQEAANVDIQFRGAVGVVLMFDLTSADSFKWVKAAYILLPQNNCRAVVLVGNKTDQMYIRAVSKAEASDWAAANNLDYFECSAKTGEGVEDSIFSLTSTAYELVINEASHKPWRPNVRYDIWSRLVDIPSFVERDISKVIFTEEQLRQTFDKLDVSGSGYIDMEDFHMLNCHFEDTGISEEEITRVLEQSRNHVPGKLTFDEFAILMLRIAKA